MLFKLKTKQYLVILHEEGKTERYLCVPKLSGGLYIT